MSGDTGSSNNVMTIEFNQAAYRGLGGLGFNIRGGKDFPFISEDSGIFVTKIRDKGAVANLRQNEKRLEPGDRLLEINGQSLEDVYHEEAVRIIGSAKQYDRVVLKFIPISKDKKKYQIMKQFDPQPYSQKSIVLRNCVTITAIAGLVYLGYKMKVGDRLKNMISSKIYASK